MQHVDQSQFLPGRSKIRFQIDRNACHQADLYAVSAGLRHIYRPVLTYGVYTANIHYILYAGLSYIQTHTNAFVHRP